MGAPPGRGGRSATSKRCVLGFERRLIGAVSTVVAGKGSLVLRHRNFADYGCVPSTQPDFVKASRKLF